MSDPAPRLMHLGARTDADHARTDERVALRPSDLTTHGVIVGMTGSGKTGLGIVLVEEAARAGVPVIAVDPKGDLGNLALTFPTLAPEEFAPWVDPAVAERVGTDVTALAATTATAWREGLAGWGLGPDDVAGLRAAAEVVVLTPGSTAGIPLNLVGSLAAPTDVDDDTRRSEIEGTVSGLLGLVGIDADPLAGREHILLSNLVARAWDSGTSLDLPGLVAQVQDPPLRKLGVIELDAFFPAADRRALALRLNGLLASPSFAAWAQGEPLDIGCLLRAPDGRPRVSVVTLSHLSDPERHFVLALLLGRLVSWTRAQSGTGELRALLYVDEVFGFAPPSAQPPAKRPLLTLLKQARAQGVGVVLATQNPVDLDYTAISNAGTWMIGRLQTERDRARLLDGMTSATGGTDRAVLDATVAGLATREFVLHRAGSAAPQTFTTRWAMSYLRGPMTRDELRRLAGSSADQPADGEATGPGAASDTPAPVPEATTAPAPPIGDDESPVPPEVGSSVIVRWLDPAAPWAASIGAVPGGTRLAPFAALQVDLRYSDARAGIDHTETWEAVLPIDGPAVDPAAAIPVDHDPRDWRAEPPAGAVYVLTAAPLHQARFFTSMRTAVRDHLVASEALTVLRNPELSLWSRVGETAEEFAHRCHAEAEAREDAEADTIRRAVATKVDRVRAAMARAEDRVAELETERRTTRSDELLSGAGDLLSTFLGGRRSSSSIAASVRRASGKRSRSTRLDQRMETAANRVAEQVDRLEELEDELADAILALDDRWRAAAERTEEVELGLTRARVTVADPILVWVPVA